MTEVDFYILKDGGDTHVLRTACRVVQKAWQQGLRIYVLAGDEAQSRRIDELLWTFKQDSFIAHELWSPSAQTNDDESTASLPRVLIGTATELPQAPQVLVNLGAPVPEWFSKCERIAEIVGAEAHSKSEGRKRYRAYREHGESGDKNVSLRTHEV